MRQQFRKPAFLGILAIAAALVLAINAFLSDVRPCATDTVVLKVMTAA